MQSAHPTIGKPGKMEQVEEIKIEFVCEQDKVKAVISAIKKSHPYEEVPIDIVQLLDLEE